MQILAKVDAHVGIWMHLVAMFVLSVSTLNKIVSKQSEMEKSYSHCGPLFSKGPRSLKTSSLEELETILSAWFKQVRNTSASVDRPHLKEKALHVAAGLGINSLWASGGWCDCFKKIHKWVYKTVSGYNAIVNPETVMDWKSKELPKIIYRYQPKDMLNVDETGLFCNPQSSTTLIYEGGSSHGGTK